MFFCLVLVLASSSFFFLVCSSCDTISVCFCVLCTFLHKNSCAFPQLCFFARCSFAICVRRKNWLSGRQFDASCQHACLHVSHLPPNQDRPQRRPPYTYNIYAQCLIGARLSFVKHAEALNALDFSLFRGTRCRRSNYSCKHWPHGGHGPPAEGR